MIKDKELGMKFAENSKEAIWHRFRLAREASIKELQDSLIIEKELLKLAKKKTK